MINGIARFLKREYLYLFIIVFIAGFLRFWNLTGVPPSLSHDEVAIGYNAYSILLTGKDEYGETFPLLFRSFDDYKLPGMVYISIPSIAIFGLNEMGVRFPSALLGTLAVFVFYFFAKELVKNKIKSLIITFFFAISIWHINFSRQSFESNGAVFFLILGTYFLLRFKNNPKNFFFAIIFYSISLYFYYSIRLVIPFLLLSFILVYRKEIVRYLNTILIGVVVGLIIVFPLIPSLFSSGGFARINIVSVVNDPRYVDRKEEFVNKIVQNDTLINRIIYNRRVALLITIGENYLKNLDPKHIFFIGTTSAGLLYPVEAPFFFLGIYSLSKLKTRNKWIVLFWFLSAPLAGALTVDQPNPLRTLPNAPMFSIFSGLGFVSALYFLKSKFAKALLITGTAAPFLYLFFYLFWFNYFIYNPQRNALSFGDGYKQMVQYVEKNEHKYKALYISGQYWRPYIFTLFWKKYDPLVYQKDVSIWHFGKYYFSAAEWDKEGIYFGPFNKYDVDFYSLAKTKIPQETLFILAKPEFDKYQTKFNKVDVIDGKFAKGVFVSAVLK